MSNTPGRACACWGIETGREDLCRGDPCDRPVIFARFPSSASPPRPSFPCLRRGLFLDRPRKRPKKKGDAQAGGGCFSANCPCGGSRRSCLPCRAPACAQRAGKRHRQVCPADLLGVFGRWCWGDLREKAPSTPQRIPFFPTILPKLSPLPSKNLGARASRPRVGVGHGWARPSCSREHGRLCFEWKAGHQGDEK